MPLQDMSFGSDPVEPQLIFPGLILILFVNWSALNLFAKVNLCSFKASRVNLLTIDRIESAEQTQLEQAGQ